MRYIKTQMLRYSVDFRLLRHTELVPLNIEHLPQNISGYMDIFYSARYDHIIGLISLYS